jgi:hypothetical protein
MKQVKKGQIRHFFKRTAGVTFLVVKVKGDRVRIKFTGKLRTGKTQTFRLEHIKKNTKLHPYYNTDLGKTLLGVS